MSTKQKLNAATNDAPKTFDEALESIFPLICKLASETTVDGMESDDIQQELCIHAFFCWQKYDPDRGTKFITFVYPALKSKKNELVRNSKSQRRGGGVKPVSLDESYDEMRHNLPSNKRCNSLHEILASGEADLDDLMVVKEICGYMDEVIETYSSVRARKILRQLLDGEPQKNVCKANDCTQSLVSYYLRDFRAKLKERLLDEGYDIP